MGILDDLLGKELGGLAGTAMKNPQIISAILSMLSTKDASVGGNAGLGGLVQAFQGKGMGDLISSWISTGPNPSVSESQITDVLGKDTIDQFANKAGVPAAAAGGLLASLLPAVIDRLTPQGHVPEANSLDSMLGGLLSSLGK
jgi:uncharacterized protein YidB (DUF937 family)